MVKKVEEMFPEFHQEKISNNDFKKEKNNLIVLDTNFLLQILELPIDIASKYIDSLKEIKNNLYIPYLVALEFHFNKSTKKKNKARNAQLYVSNIEKKIEELEKSVSDIELLKMENGNEELNKLKGNLELFKKDFLNRVNSFVQNEITDKEDKLYNEVLNVISYSVGEQYSQDWIDAVENEGNSRYLENIPPGFNDSEKIGVRKYNGITYRQKFGDLIIWKDILEKSKEQSNYEKVIFITNDGESTKKNDWIYKTSNMKVGPDIFLMNELKTLSNKKLYILNNTTFVNMINELTIEEIDRIEFEEEKKYIVKIPEWRLEETIKEIADKNSKNQSDIIWFLDSENRLAKIDYDKLTIQNLVSILSDRNESEMLKEELLKKIENQPESPLSKEINNMMHNQDENFLTKNN